MNPLVSNGLSNNFRRIPIWGYWIIEADAIWRGVLYKNGTGGMQYQVVLNLTSRNDSQHVVHAFNRVPADRGVGRASPVMGSLFMMTGKPIKSTPAPPLVFL